MSSYPVSAYQAQKNGRTIAANHAPLSWAAEAMTSVRGEDALEARKLQYLNSLIDLRYACAHTLDKDAIRYQITIVAGIVEEHLDRLHVHRKMSLDQELHNWQQMVVEVLTERQRTHALESRHEVAGYGETNASADPSNAAAGASDEPCGLACQAKRAALKAKLYAQEQLMKGLKGLLTSSIADAQLLFREINPDDLHQWAQDLANDLKLNITISRDVKDLNSLLPVLMMNVPNILTRASDIQGTMQIMNKHLLGGVEIAKRTILKRVESIVRDASIQDPAKVKMLPGISAAMGLPTNLSDKDLPPALIKAIQKLASSDSKMADMKSIASKLIAIKSLALTSS